MKNLIIIFIGIALISLVSASAYNLTAGESQSFDLGEEFSYYSIVGNSTPINLNISQEGTIVTIIPDKYSLNDTFTIIFFNKEKEVIYSSGGGGGGGRTVTIVKNQTVEVPTYIDREVPIEIIKEVPAPQEPNYFFPLLIVVLGILVIIKLYFIVKKRKIELKGGKRKDEQENFSLGNSHIVFGFS